MHTQEDDKATFVIRIPWDSNTVRGFIAALLLIVCFVIISPFISLRPLVLKGSQDSTSIPIDVIKLHFGAGDGAGKSHGNLQAEGAAQHAAKTVPRMSDASAPKNSATKTKAAANDPSLVASRVIPVKQDPKKSTDQSNSKSDANTSTKKSTAQDHSGSEVVGDKSATNGNGRGIVGDGSGSGQGFDLTWGGGGGALVLNKQIPKAPKGLDNSTHVRLKFTVDTNGDVASVVPLTRGAPLAEQAAIKALWLWKFKVKNGQRAEGVIKFSFDIN